MAKMEVLHLTPSERGELEAYREIEERLGAAPSTISRWKRRYEEDGVLGLATIHPGQPPQKLTPQLRAKVLERTRKRLRMDRRIGRCARWQR